MTRILTERKTYFVDVILPLALRQFYTYRVPFTIGDEVQVGKRVIVQFGKSKVYSAIVFSVHEKAPSNYQAKYIMSVLDHVPIVNDTQLKHWQWISSYYMCTIGEVMASALPSGLKLASESLIQLNPDYDSEQVPINDKEFLIVDALEIHGSLTLVEVAKIVDQKTTFSLIKSMLEKGVITVTENLKSKFKPKTVSCVRLTKQAGNEERLKEIFDQLSKAPKQLELLMGYVTLSNRYQDDHSEVLKRELQESTSSSAGIINQLVKKEILELYSKEIGRLSMSSINAENGAQVQLTVPQKKAFEQIDKAHKSKDVVLLHGITSSGKTEIYIKLIQKILETGQQVLYLLPEIALTAQIITRLRKHFGNKVGVYHSKFNENERVEVWNSILGQSPSESDEKFDIIIGARSALFLPFQNLGLVIVDEEHENSFKQYSPAPRYHARDAAIYLAGLHKAKTVLGTATPAIESYYNAKEGKYGFVELNSRYADMVLPEIIPVDLSEEHRKKRIVSHFSTKLIAEMEKALNLSEQIILFQNRRGFSSFLECNTCNWIPQCVNCDVTLTYHKFNKRMQCHYCGYAEETITRCGACGNNDMQTRGFGTEMIEEDLAETFPKAKVRRMDLDSTRSKHAYSNIISDFEEGVIDILVGTQMVAKGLDFDNVSVVGILNADSMLNFPDFRAHERAYQLMAQVGGRSGRKKKRGTVILQTFSKGHPTINQVINNDYIGMYEDELRQRIQFRYPPFYRIIDITLRHRDAAKLDQGAATLATQLREHFGDRLLGPEYPHIARLRNMYNKVMLLKIETSASIIKAKAQLASEIETFKLSKIGKSTRVIVDVDPL
ncbi:MAG: primosomal protein N' [Bacteroidetes bacterium]|nr:MAG: primosomal protein N' [Bacteroidota bacterium]